MTRFATGCSTRIAPRSFTLGHELRPRPVGVAAEHDPQPSPVKRAADPRPIMKSTAAMSASGSAAPTRELQLA